MRKLFLIRAPGLTPGVAVRGDQAWNVSDLIAEGSFAPISGTPDLSKAASGIPKECLTEIEIPFKDSPSFDLEVGRVRVRASGAAIAIISETVFISQHPFPDLKPGTRVEAADLPRFLAEMVR